MALQRCPKGHFFDPKQFEQCNVCASMEPVEQTVRKLAEPATPAIAPVQELLVGWLVRLDTGEDFRLLGERSFIGRSSSMDVTIDDPQIAQENHASITYDAKKIRYTLTAGPTDGKVRLNAEQLEARSSKVLQPRDQIQVGSTNLVFVPVCNEKFQWTI